LFGQKKDFLLGMIFKERRIKQHHHGNMQYLQLMQITDFDPVQKSTKIKLKINSVKMEVNFVPKKSWLREGRGAFYFYCGSIVAGGLLEMV
jgi:hypothetical protein